MVGWLGRTRTWKCRFAKCPWKCRRGFRLIPEHSGTRDFSRASCGTAFHTTGTAVGCDSHIGFGLPNTRAARGWFDRVARSLRRMIRNLQVGRLCRNTQGMTEDIFRIIFALDLHESLQIGRPIRPGGIWEVTVDIIQEGSC